MTPCKQYEDLIPLYLNKALDSNEMIQIQNHLKECDRCRQYQFSLSVIIDKMEAGKVTPPASYGAELVVTLNRRLEKRKSRQKKLLWAIPAFSSVAAVIVIMLINIMQPHINDQQWFEQFKQEHGYVNFSDVGYFGEIVLLEDENTTATLTENTEDLYQTTVYEVLNEETLPEVDRYLLATASMDDREFENIVNQMKHEIL